MRLSHTICAPHLSPVQQPQHSHDQGTLLDASHPDTKLVSGVAERLIAVLAQGHGGGECVDREVC